MKVRNGFVSNSSSSSFIVGFTSKPRSAKAVQALLFGNRKRITVYDEWAPAERLAKRIFDDLRRAKPISRRESIDTCTCGYIDRGDDQPAEPICVTSFGTPFGYDYHRARLASWRSSKKAVDALLCGQCRIKLYKLIYSDDDADRDEAILEHAQVFRAIPHIRINMH